MLLVVIVWYFLQLVMVLTRQFDSFLWASQVVLVVKNHLRKQETKEMQVGSLGWEDPLEEAMATHSSIFAWRIPVDRGAWWATAHEVTNSRTWLSN